MYQVQSICVYYVPGTKYVILYLYSIYTAVYIICGDFLVSRVLVTPPLPRSRHASSTSRVQGSTGLAVGSYSDPPSPSNEHDEDADVLEASGATMSGVLGDEWESRCSQHRSRRSSGGLGRVSDEAHVSDEVRWVGIRRGRGGGGEAGRGGRGEGSVYPFARCPTVVV